MLVLNTHEVTTAHTSDDVAVVAAAYAEALDLVSDGLERRRPPQQAGVRAHPAVVPRPMTVPTQTTEAVAGSTSGRFPRWLIAVMTVCLVAAAVMMFAGGWLGGVTWDEKTHVLMLDTFLDQGWNVSPDALVAGVPDPSYIWGVYVYGPVGELVAHAFAAALGTEPWGMPSLEAAAYAGRHIGIGVMALAGVAAAAWIVRSVTGSWAWGLVGATVLAVTPVWLGHGMFNIKDIPVAAGYTIASAGGVALLREDYFARRAVRWTALAALAVGAVLGAGTRAAIGVPIAAGVVIGLLALWLARWRTHEAPLGAVTKDALRRLAEAAGALVVGYLLLVLIYPKAFINPVVLAWEALVVSARFPYDEAVLTSGTWVEQPPPWTYLPQWFLAQLPLIVILGSLLFLGVWAWSAIRLVLGRRSSLSTAAAAMGAVVVAQALLMPILAILLRSNMYNGTRQFLFVVPALAVLATLGLWWVSTRALGSARGRVARGLVWAAITVGVVAPLVAQSTLFPYNYTFLNSVAAIRPVEGNWPTDYWRFGGRELMTLLPPGPESCGYEQGRQGSPHPCSDEPMFIPYLGIRGSEAQGGLEPGEYWYVQENQGDLSIPPGCEVHEQIVRRLFWQDVVIGQISTCRL